MGAKEIKVGDTALIWISGKYAGIYAIAEIIRGPSEDIEDSERDKMHRIKDDVPSEFDQGLKVLCKFKFRFDGKICHRW